MKLRIIIAFTTLFCTTIMAQQSVKENISVLFIGNSYTFMNNMPFIFQKMAKEDGYNAYVDTVVQGGKNLEFHANRKITYDKIRSRNWTYVVIQGHSNEFAQPKTEIEKKSKMYLSRIIDSVRTNNSCTKIVLYMTWAYKNGNPNWEPINSYEKMQNMVAENYMWMAKDFNAIVCPVGKIWEDVRTKKKDLNLYIEDEKHPNLYGSYISAATFFTTITKLSPIGNTIKIDLAPETKEFIEREVFSIATEFSRWRNYPEEMHITPGFDVVVNNRSVHVYDNSIGGLETSYKVNGKENFTFANPEFVISRKDSTLTIQQDVKDVCRSVSLTRKIELH
jgi:hypothetical protein